MRFWDKRNFGSLKGTAAKKIHGFWDIDEFPLAQKPCTYNY